MSSSFTDYADRYIDCGKTVYIDQSNLNNVLRYLKEPEHIVPVEHVILKTIINLEPQQSFFVSWDLGSVELVSILSYIPFDGNNYTTFLNVPNLISRVSADGRKIQILNNEIAEGGLTLDGQVIFKIDYTRDGY